MHKFWIIGCLMLSGCTIDHDSSRSQRGGVGVFPERSALPGSQAERTKKHYVEPLCQVNHRIGNKNVNS